MKSILLSMRPEHAVNVLNGYKTLELRTNRPKDLQEFIKQYGGVWVYIYVSKGERNLYRFNTLFRTTKHRGFEDVISNSIYQNQKVVARFWLDEYNVIDWFGSSYLSLGSTNENETMREFTDKLISNLCINYEEVDKYLRKKSGYAWHIKNLEIFDKPKELSEFYKWVRKTIYSGMDCPPYVDEVKKQVSRAPQSWMFVYVKENL